MHRLNHENEGPEDLKASVATANDVVGTMGDLNSNFTMNFTREGAGFENNLNSTIEDQKLTSQMLELKNKQMEQPVCRICLSEEEPSNPLITPCKCTGSLANIHLECIREWLEGKKHQKETPFVNSYIWKQLECEICKNPYSDITQLKNGTEVSLLKYTIHEDAKSYMIIESVTNTNSKTIHVVNFSARSRVKVGRGQNAEVRITDISVSRLHTFITCTKFGNVFIEDN